MSTCFSCTRTSVSTIPTVSSPRAGRPRRWLWRDFRSFASLVVTEALKIGLGILGMKSMGSGVITTSNTATPQECLAYALNLPASVVITGTDSHKILEQASQVASNFKPLSATAGRRDPGENEGCGAARGTRATQDLGSLRQHRETSRMAGRRDAPGPEARADVVESSHSGPRAYASGPCTCSAVC